MQLFNTLTRTTDIFNPQDESEVKVYTCGPTVYNYQHIGNYAYFIRCDILIRTLRILNYNVNWVMNITDVGHLVSDADDGEDKMEKGAKREGKTAWEVAKFYSEDFIEGLISLNITKPSHLVKATDHIPEQIELIKRLEQKDYIYTIDDGVYFDTAKFPKYGELALLKLDDLKPGARVIHNHQKRNSSDFALWKFSPADSQRDMEWESPWGKGFPGWHLECSAMAIKYLGETLDIHVGGIDHIPVHHTNEIAQSEGATGKLFSKFWVHSNFLNVNGTKISKSLGNVYTLHDLVVKGYDLLDFRMFVLQSNYRTEANFSYDALDGARNRLNNWRNIAALRYQAIEISESQVETPDPADIIIELGDDLNTPMALAKIDEIFGFYEKGVNTDQIEDFEELLTLIDLSLGLDLMKQIDITDDQKSLLSERIQVRTNKDWAHSDTLRDTLKSQGIQIRDTGSQQIWSRIVSLLSPS